MLITPSQKRLHLHDSVLNLTFNNDTLKNVDNDKVLGFHIDRILTRSFHIQFIVKKSSSNRWHRNNIFFAIKNFQLFRKDRILSAYRLEQGGGIIVYVKDDIKCARRSNLECENSECVWLDFFF